MTKDRDTGEGGGKVLVERDGDTKSSWKDRRGHTVQRFRTRDNIQNR